MITAHTDVVGSLLRPVALRKARDDWVAGRLSHAQFKSIEDRAVAMPMAPQECIDVPGPEAVDGLGHLALERKPPHFVVGHDVEPRRLLKADGLIDGAILYGFELRVTKTPRHPVVPRFA